LAELKESRKHSAYYKYLDPFLEKGNHEEIKKAKAEWRKKYKAEWRKINRKENKEITVPWAKNELRILKTESTKHRLSNTQFIKKAVMAYIDKRYIVPDVLAVRTLLQFLAMEYNTIQEMINEKDLNLQSGQQLLEKIDEQEKAIRVALYSPKTLEQVLTEMIRKDSKTKERIYRLLERFDP
jgi:hypothetical protein